jgi:uncharacterized radical SAM protein YgiQ
LNSSQFLPTTREEVRQRGWDALDVILVSGDSYIDSPYIGAAVIGRVLEDAGYRVGIIAQPDINSNVDITRLGEPKLMWGVTGGSVDSMVANYTASRKKRRRDDYTPGGENDRRPNRAVMVYTNMIRRFFKNTRPIVLGGIEASLRRVAHYDYWSDSVRRSILFDAKADYLLYGMAEGSILKLAHALKDNADVTKIRGLCYIAKESPEDHLELPAYEQVSKNKHTFIDMFHTFYKNTEPLNARGLTQRHGDRYLVQNRPAEYLTQGEMDAVYALPYQRAQHPFYESQGKARALETIRFSINTQHGCYGECNFCSIAVHEGRTVRWRSEASVVAEAKLIAKLSDFKGYILDVGGPTANMYGFECPIKLKEGACQDKRCIYPVICAALKPTHARQTALLKRLRKIPGVKKVFVSSGIRYDLVVADERNGDAYLKEITSAHVSGQLKVAPEHSSKKVLDAMGKPGHEQLLAFKDKFDRFSRDAHKDQYLTYYLIAAHPGCTQEDMYQLKKFASRELHISPEQVQLFTPLPSTYSALMYHTGLDPFTMKPIFVEKDAGKRERQKQIITKKPDRKKKRRKSGYKR